jgi:hypothetical protein
MPYKDSIKQKEYQKKYRENHKQNYLAYKRQWRKTDEGKMNYMIDSWRYTHKMKLRDNEDWESIYIQYLITEKCELCDFKFKNKKCLDHDHKTGFIRNIVCYSCNSKI